MKNLIKNEEIINDPNYKKYLNKPKLSQIKKKNINEVKREFNSEEWNILFKKIKKIKSKVSINSVDRIYNNFNKKIIYYDNKSFFKDSTKNVINKNHNIYVKTIKNYLSFNKNNNNLVELGAGYGSKIINIANHFNKKKYNINYYAGEFSLKGRQIIKKISRDSNLNIDVFKFNFMDSKSYHSIPTDSIIFTSYSVHYMDKLNNDFFKFFKSINPKIIINFEPLYETHNDKTKYGKMCKNYIDFNGYCKNQLSIYKKQERKNNIQIISLKENIFGSNPIFPISEIIWK